MRRLLFIIALLSGVCGAQTRMDASSQLAFRATNDGSTGTTVNQLAKINSSGNAVNAATTDTSTPVYIVVGGAGTTGVAQLASGGAVTCKFDASGGTSGHYVQASSTTAGTCHDAGASIPTSGWVLGTLLTSPAANATGSVLLVQGYLASTGGGSFTGGTLTSELTVAAPTTGAASVNWPSGTAPTSPGVGDTWRDATGFNMVENASNNGAFEVASSSTCAVSDANTVSFSAASNSASVSENGAACQALVEVDKTQSVTHKALDSTNTGPWLIKLGCSTPLAAPGTSLGAITVSGTKMLMSIYIAGYAAGETASIQFNASGGTAYKYRWLTSAAGATTFTAGLVAPSTDRIKIGAANTTLSRNVEAIITNTSANVEKEVMFVNGMFGTGNATTQNTLDMGNGSWISGAATTITSVNVITTGGQNMLTGSTYCVYQLVP